MFFVSCHIDLSLDDYIQSFDDYIQSLDNYIQSPDDYIQSFYNYIMKRKKIPLHTQILLALILGAAFGAFFNVDSNKLNFILQINGEEQSIVVGNWDSLVVSNKAENVSQVFYGNDQIQIVNYFKRIPASDLRAIEVVVHKGSKSQAIGNISTVEKIGTMATAIRPVGTLFIRLLSFIAIPLVIASLIVGAASIKDIKKLGRIGMKTFAIYMATTAIAITIGLTLANVIAPGNRVSDEVKNRLMGTFRQESKENIVKDMEIDITDFFVNIVPMNPIDAMGKGNMLQIVFFAVFFGVTLTFIRKKHSKPIIRFFRGVSETMIKMVDVIMKIAPYGVFALIAATIADFGFDILSTLIWYMFAVVLGLILQTSLVYSFLVKFFGKTNPIKFFKSMRNAQAIAFSTSSSAATLPVTMECVEQNIGVPKQISGFVLPLGATINMDGTALYQGVAAVFIAQVYGFDLGIAEQLTIVLTAVLASIGTAPVPGVGIIMLVMILQAIHVPPEGIALILGVDRVLDMLRTVTNVTGDAAVAVAVAEGER